MGIMGNFAVEKSALDFFDSLRRKTKISNRYQDIKRSRILLLHFSWNEIYMFEKTTQNSQITQIYIESMQQNTHEYNKVQKKVHFSKFDISFNSNTFRESPFKTQNSLNAYRYTNNNQISTYTSKCRLTSFR